MKDDDQKDPGMLNREIDQILAEDREITPSSRFTARVMAAVRAEAATPALSFPWAIALPGPVLCVAAMTWSVVEDLGQSGPPTRPDAPLLGRLLTDLAMLAQWAHVYALDWLLLTFFLVWIAWKLSVHLAGAKP